jgi:hypothetical protein
MIAGCWWKLVQHPNTLTSDIIGCDVTGIAPITLHSSLQPSNNVGFG